MTVATVPRHELVTFKCSWCDQFPCVCRIRIRTERCACGGSITADPESPAEKVREHQRTLLHSRWSKGRFE